MTTPRPPVEPLDESEREFARILRALPVGEPPAALDAGILRAAANAAAASRRPGARLLASAGALWGIGGAAAAVLALGVALEMRYSPSHLPAVESAPRAQAVSDVAEDDSVQVDLGEVRREAPAAAAEAMPPGLADQPMAARPRVAAPARQKAAGPVAMPAPVAPAAPAAAPEPFAADALDEHAAPAARAEAMDVPPSESAAILGAEQATRADAGRRDQRERSAKSAPAPQAGAAAAAAAGNVAQSASHDAAATGGLSAPRMQAPKKPATWLLEIRELRDAGRIEAARAKLVEFRRAYPNWVIPTDLAPLLPE